MKAKLKRWSPNPENLKKHKHLRWLNKYINHPSLWNFNRRSISKAFAVGLFCAFTPVPFQMILATIGSIWFLSNLPIAIALVWITNPLTIPPIYYLIYKFGAWILNTEISQTPSFTTEYIFNTFDKIWQPLLLGSFIVSIVSAILGYGLIQGIYRWRIYKKIKK
ncbi:hypothetical protein MNB_SUP05-5-331 [hydrothermal vent metagenome]|uniref:DUF2062 domain-containing protein n=1 Tax=hydrothermal vent metagenome TaxID=652676 RepID=A0A1W1BN74_9ZZZZ